MGDRELKKAEEERMGEQRVRGRVTIQILDFTQDSRGKPPPPMLLFKYFNYYLNQQSLFMNLNNLKQSLFFYKDTLKHQNLLYSQSETKRDLYAVQKTAEIGASIFHSLLVRWVFLKQNMNQEELTKMRKICVRVLENGIGEGFRSVTRVIGKMYGEGRWEQLRAVEDEIEEVLGCLKFKIDQTGSGSQDIRGFKKKEQAVPVKHNPTNPTSFPSQSENVNKQNLPRNHQSTPKQQYKPLQLFARPTQHPKPSEPIIRQGYILEMVQTESCELKTFEDNFSIQQEPTLEQVPPHQQIIAQPDPIHIPLDQLDYSAILPLNGSFEASPITITQDLNIFNQLNERCVFYQQQSMDPRNPIVFYLQNEVDHVSSQLTQLIHYLGIGQPIYRRIMGETKKTTVQCLLQIPTFSKRPLSHPQYKSTGRGHSLKIAKTQAAKRILIQIYSQNETLWTQFKFKKSTKGIST